MGKINQDNLSEALSQMQASLQKISEEHYENAWLQEGLSGLNRQLIGEKELPELSNDVIKFLADYLEVQAATLYVVNEEGHLQLTGSYAIQKISNKILQIGEGIAGEAFKKKKILRFDTIPENHLVIPTSFGNITPEVIMAIPFKFDTEVVAVIEMGKSSKFTELHHSFIKSCLEPVSITINAAINREKNKNLLRQLEDKEAQISAQFTAINKSNISMELDLTGKIIKVNDMFLDLFGYEKNEIIGKKHSFILEKGAAQKEEYKQFWADLKAGKFLRGEFKRMAKDGREIWLHGTYNPIFDAEENVVKIILLKTDITEQKEQQRLIKEQSEELQTQHEELQQANSELQQQQTELEQANIDLENQAQELQTGEEELRSQQKELEIMNVELEKNTELLEIKNKSISEKNNALEKVKMELERRAEDLEVISKYKSEFLANMSHELRTPLNSILLLSKMLSENNEKNLSEEQIEFADVIYNSGTGLLELINDILDLSKIEAGQMNFQIQEIATKNIIDDIRALFKAEAKSKKLDFKVTWNEKPANIVTDKLRLEQILKNLLSNAFKFTEKGKVSLNVKKIGKRSKLRKIAGDRDGMIAFSVTDTGIGIPGEKLEKIFGAFQQADGSTSRKYGGTGLGLSISREIAAKMGGYIHAESAVNKGSTFTLLIPQNTEIQEQTRALAKTDSIPGAIRAVEKTEKYSYLVDNIPKEIADDRNNLKKDDSLILIIEDDTKFAKILLTLSRRRGYKGIVAVRGDQGLEFAEKYKPTGILLDIHLPVMDGWTVMKELKDNKQTRHIPVHIMSSLEKKKESLDMGAVDFINKPAVNKDIKKAFDEIEKIIKKTTKQILLIEDNIMHQKSMISYLGNSTKKCLTARTAKEGLKILEKEDIDCLILDMGLPDANGYEVLEKIRKKPKYEKLPIIIYTGKSLSLKEEQRINKYTNTVIIKTADSFQRLMDEVTFFLHLVEDSKSKKAVTGKKPYIPDVALKDKQVLLVDDDVRNLFSLTKVLEKEMMNVHTAGNGKEAITQLESGTEVDIILLDMMMPEMDGYEAAKKIRNMKNFKKTPVIAITAKTMLGDREKCIQAGASDYISKPVDTDQLISLLRVWLY